MTTTTESKPLPAHSATVTELKPVWLSEDAQGWHVHGTLTTVTGTEVWGAEVDEVGDPLTKRWISITKGYTTREEEVVILAAIEHAIIMSGAEDDSEPTPVVCMGLDALRELDALQRGE